MLRFDVCLQLFDQYLIVEKHREYQQRGKTERLKVKGDAQNDVAGVEFDPILC